jgi:DNA-binding MarR family transcriptional regulator
MPSRLQAEIKQTKPFPRRSSEALLSVMRTAALLEHQLNEALRPYAITELQYNVLRILRGAGKDGLCGREIGERLVSKVPDVSRLLDRMEDLGLMTRERDPDDRRHVTARVTPKGLKILIDAEPTLRAIEERHTGTLSAAELKDLVEALDAVRTSQR